MKLLSSTLPFLFIGLPVIAEVAEETVSPHYDVALKLLRVLSQTELTLNSCKDGKSIENALPKLKELSQQMEEILEIQSSLLDPNEEDTRQINTLVNQFATLAKAIQEHVLRLHKDGLYSASLEEILLIRLD